MDLHTLDREIRQKEAARECREKEDAMLRNAGATTGLQRPYDPLLAAYQDKPAPTEPALLQRAFELRGYILDFTAEVARLRGNLFCTEPNCCEKEKEQELYGLEAILADTCQRAASLVGEMRSINERVG